MLYNFVRSNLFSSTIVFTQRSFSSINKKLDFSRVPQLNEKELEETYVRGDGPGGQATNKTSNCVQLRHVPTNIIIKYHGTRSLTRNRDEARRLLVSKLDDYYNKDMSIENQRKRFEKVKSLKLQNKNEKLRRIKSEFKEQLKSNDVNKSL